MGTICKHKGKQVLLVEGKNDCHVVLALCQYHSLPKTFGIYGCENDDGLLKLLNALIIQPPATSNPGTLISILWMPVILKV